MFDLCKFSPPFPILRSSSWTKRSLWVEDVSKQRTQSVPKTIHWNTFFRTRLVSVPTTKCLCSCADKSTVTRWSFSRRWQTRRLRLDTFDEYLVTRCPFNNILSIPSTAVRIPGCWVSTCLIRVGGLVRDKWFCSVVDDKIYLALRPSLDNKLRLFFLDIYFYEWRSFGIFSVIKLREM